MTKSKAKEHLEYGWSAAKEVHHLETELLCCSISKWSVKWFSFTKEGYFVDWCSHKVVDRGRNLVVREVDFQDSWDMENS